MIPRELEAKIVRLHVAEKWPVHTIAAQLGVHHDSLALFAATSTVVVTSDEGAIDGTPCRSGLDRGEP